MPKIVLEITADIEPERENGYVVAWVPEIGSYAYAESDDQVVDRAKQMAYFLLSNMSFDGACSYLGKRGVSFRVEHESAHQVPSQSVGATRRAQVEVGARD